MTSAVGLCLAASASAYDAKVTWKPVANAAGYKIYVGYDADLKGTPRDVGKPATDAAGSVQAVTTGLPMGPTANFSVAAYSSGGTLSPVSARLALTYGVVAKVVDTDGDGLTDADEDLDLDRVKDANETDPKVADTDGDGVSDGLEVAQGSNPLLASSKPACLGACASAIWIAAEKPTTRSGNMKVDGAFAAGADNDSLANALRATQLFASSTANAMYGGSGDIARYDVSLPAAGTWYLWARSYYPGVPGSNDANSFLARVDSKARLKLGNKRDKFRTWHWDGNGSFETGAVKPLSLGTLSAGNHKLYVEKREVQPTPPRLDVLVLTQSATYVPNDADALVGLASSSFAQLASLDAELEPIAGDDAATTTTTTSTTTITLAPVCESDADCDDGVSCTLDRCEEETCSNLPFDALCDDGNLCNGVESCDPGDDCRAGQKLACDDGRVCNGAEWCHPGFGCLEGVALDCDDGVACTLDRCFEEAGGCRIFGFNLACNDDNPCTDDRCTVDGCAYDSTATSTCDDALACTTDDACAGGACTGRDTCEPGFVCDAQQNDCVAVSGDPDRDGLRGDEDPCPVEVRNLCVGPVAVDSQTGWPVRVNSHPGGASCSGTRVDCNGDTWLTEFGAETAGRGSLCGRDDDGADAIALQGDSGECTVAGVERVFGCVNDATRDLIACSRVGEPGQPLEYRFAVPDGGYVVNLIFTSLVESRAADDGSVGFDVVIEGRTEHEELDLMELGGGWGATMLRSFVVEATGGLEISLRPRGGDAQVSAIEVLQVVR